MKHTAPPLRPARTRYLLEHPEQFNIATLESNEMDRGDDLPPLAKIPQMENRIRLTPDKGGYFTNVMFVIGRGTEENGEKTVILGHTSKTMLPGMMTISDTYHDYFDTSGNLICDPMNPGDEKEAENEEPTDKEATEDETEDEPDNPEEELQRRIKEEFRQHNAIRLGNTTFVRIPEIPSRIRILKPNNKGIRNVQYIYAQWYDPTSQQNRNRKTVIGYLADECPDAMIPNDRYNRFFDIETGLPRPEPGTEPIQQPQQTQELQPNETDLIEEIEDQLEKERQKQREQLSRLLRENPEEAIAMTQRQLDKMREEMQEKTQDEMQQENEPLSEPLDSLYDRVIQKNGRKEILRDLLDEINYTISNQAKKHPETLISTYKAQKINAVLIELRLLAHGSGFEDFLELIREPEEVEQDGVKYLTGMTYSDAEVLLSHYTVVLNYLRRQHR